MRVNKHLKGSFAVSKEQGSHGRKMSHVKEVSPPGTERQRSVEVVILRAICAGVEDMGVLHSEFFVTPGAAQIYRLLQEELDRQGTVDKISLAESIKKINVCIDEDISPASLFSDPPVKEIAVRYAEILRSWHESRRWIRLKEEIGGLEPTQELAGKILGIIERNTTRGYAVGSETAKDMLPAILETIEKRRKTGKKDLLGLPTYIKELDSLTMGLTGITVLGGMPGAGKSTLALQIGVNVARGGPNKDRERYPVIIYSFEMPKSRLIAKILSPLTGNLSDTEILLGRKIGKEPSGFHDAKIAEAPHWDTMKRATKEFLEFGDYIQIFRPHEFSGGITPELIRSHIHAAKKRTGKTRVYVLIDPIQGMASQMSIIKGYSQGMRESLEYLMPLLDGLAEETNCAIMLVSKKNRASKGSGEMDVYLGSSAIEYAAAIALNLITPGEIAGGKSTANLETRYLHVVKQKYGLLGEISLELEGHLSYFK